MRRYLGIEPGDQGQEGARRFDIPVIQDFFPSPKISGKFDVIILYAILEHIPSPEQFLKEVSKYLNPNGKIVISVPNCEQYINSGDISFLFHEHWSYFTPDTLKNTINQANQLLIQLKKSQFAEILYGVSSPALTQIELDSVLIKNQIKLAEQFKILSQKNFKNLANILETAAGDQHTVGIYVPGRALNILSLLIPNVNLPKLRFFDDNPLLYRTYYPGINVLIERRQDLILSPPELIIIFTYLFWKKD